MALLARNLSEGHRDPWLHELISNPAPAGGFRALAEARKANIDARHDEGLRHARIARRFFNTRSNRAGAARASLEEVYALSRSFRIRECLDEAAGLSKLIKTAQYEWIQGQLRLEQSVCAFHNGQFESALKEVQRALEQIASFGYETLNLRGLGFEASLRTLLGDTATRRRRTGEVSICSGRASTRPFELINSTQICTCQPSANSVGGLLTPLRKKQ